MPRMTGYEATESLRKKGFTKPIIAVTASALSDEREHCLSVGMNDILIKPFKRPDLEKILDKWEKILAGKRNPANLNTPADSLSVEGVLPAEGSIPVEGPEIVTSRASGMAQWAAESLPAESGAETESVSVEGSIPVEGPEIAASRTNGLAQWAAESLPAEAPAPSPQDRDGGAGISAGEIFNAPDMIDTFMGNTEMAVNLLARFLERSEQQIKAIPELRAAEDWPTAQREAHTIKGSALTMSAKDLGQKAARLEKAFKNLDFSEIDAAWPPVEEAYGRLKAVAEKWIEDTKKTL
jgi:HPt (histidine-containing phosphotransfer) domain-containing protein